MEKQEKQQKETKRAGIDMSKLLSELNAIEVSAPAEPQVQHETLQKWATGMRRLGYVFTEVTLKALESYLKGYNIWLVGRTGIGKTAFFRCISCVRRSIENPRAYALHEGYGALSHLSMIETQAWRMEDAKDWLEQNKEDDVVLDDIGTEPKMVSYGQEAELFPYLLEDRLWRRNVRTHVTTNMSLNEIRERYGDRVRDRVNEMFMCFPLTSKSSLRKTKVWRRGVVV